MLHKAVKVQSLIQSQVTSAHWDCDIKKMTSQLPDSSESLPSGEYFPIQGTRLIMHEWEKHVLANLLNTWTPPHFCWILHQWEAHFTSRWYANLPTCHQRQWPEHQVLTAAAWVLSAALRSQPELAPPSEDRCWHRQNSCLQRAMISHSISGTCADRQPYHK